MRLTLLFVHTPAPFRMIRSGRTPAKNAVAETGDFWHELDAGELAKLEGSLPACPRHHQAEFADLRLERAYDPDLGEVPARELQRVRNRPSSFETPGKHTPGFRFKYRHRPAGAASSL